MISSIRISGKTTICPFSDSSILLRSIDLLQIKRIYRTSTQSSVYSQVINIGLREDDIASFDFWLSGKMNNITVMAEPVFVK
jgi:hypothetical protein